MSKSEQFLDLDDAAVLAARDACCWVTPPPEAPDMAPLPAASAANVPYFTTAALRGLAAWLGTTPQDVVSADDVRTRRHVRVYTSAIMSAYGVPAGHVLLPRRAGGSYVAWRTGHYWTAANALAPRFGGVRAFTTLADAVGWVLLDDWQGAIGGTLAALETMMMAAAERGDDATLTWAARRWAAGRHWAAFLEAGPQALGPRRARVAHRTIYETAPVDRSVPLLPVGGAPQAPGA